MSPPSYLRNPRDSKSTTSRKRTLSHIFDWNTNKVHQNPADYVVEDMVHTWYSIQGTLKYIFVFKKHENYETQGEFAAAGWLALAAP